MALGLVCLLSACSGGDDAATGEGEGGQGGGAQAGGGSGASGKGGGAGGGAGGAQAGRGGGAGVGGAQGGQGGEAGQPSAGGEGGEGGEAGEGGAGGENAGGGEPGGEGGMDPTGGGGSPGTAGTDPGTAGTGTGTAGTGQAGSPPEPPKWDVEMTYTTANIGRNYKTKAEVQAVFNKIADIIGGKSGPRLIGWQEIGEADPCGDCERDALDTSFKSSADWFTFQPKGDKPGGGAETVKVPVTSKGTGGKDAKVRAVFASPGWAGVSPTRFVTVVHYPDRNLSHVNTHFIAGAWSCENNQAQRRDYWKQAWAALKQEVAEEHQKGRNVVATGDLNRPRAKNNCNPEWDPSSLHPDAKIVGGEGIDYIYAVPASGNKFNPSNSGEIAIGIDGHKGHWVTGKFVAK